jgi:hypothetical protein
VDPSHSEFRVTQNNVLNDGVAPHAAWVIVRDAQDNVIGSKSVSFTIDEGSSSVLGPVLDGGGVSKSVVSDGLTGEARVQITSHEPGTFPVHAVVEGGIDLGSKSVTFTPGPASGANSTWSVTPSVKVSVDDPEGFTVDVTVKSVNDLLVPNALVLFPSLPGDVHIVEAGPYVTGMPGSAAYGTVQVHVRSAKPGSYAIHASVQGGYGPETIPPATIMVEFKAGAPSTDPTKTYLTSPSDPAIADGIDTQVIGAVVQDSHGNPVVE